MKVTKLACVEAPSSLNTKRMARRASTTPATSQTACSARRLYAGRFVVTSVVVLFSRAACILTVLRTGEPLANCKCRVRAAPNRDRRSAGRAQGSVSTAGIPGGPGPARVRNRTTVRPCHVGVDEGVSAIVLADLTGYQRDPGGGRRRLGVPAGDRITRIEVIGVETGSQLMAGIRRLVAEPAA